MAVKSDDTQNTLNPDDGSHNTSNVSNNVNVTPPNINVPSTEDVLPKKTVEELLAKARQDEKNKLYPEIEKLKTKSTELETIKKSLEQQIQARTKEVEELRAGKLSELDSVNKELTDLKETNLRLSAAIEEVASEAAEKIRRSELASYKERRLRESGLKKLHAMVAGNSIDEIEASLKSAQEIESSLMEAAKEDAMAHLANNLPRPLAPDGSHGRDVLDLMTPQKRSQIVKSSDAEYQTKKAELLAEAKRKAGM